MREQNGKSINEKVVHFADLGSILIKARSEGVDSFVVLYAVMLWDQLVASVKEVKRLARPVDYDYWTCELRFKPLEKARL